MKNSTSTKQAKTMFNAQFITLFLGLLSLIFFFYNGAKMTMTNPDKEAMLVGVIFSMLVISFSIFSITHTNK